MTTNNDQNFLYYLIVDSLLNKTSSISVFAILVMSTFVAYYLQNDLQAVSATIVDAKDQLMPFDIKAFDIMEMFGTGQNQNETAKNSSTIGAGDNRDQITPCEMPPCPLGQACIQSCP